MFDDGLILLFGMPRSGTTWVGKIFDSHPQTLYRHEPDTWKRLDMLRYPNVTEAPQYAEKIRSFVKELPAIRALRVAGKRPFFFKAYHSPIRNSMVLTSNWMALAGSRLVPNCPIAIRSAVVGYPEQRIVWKSIESLGRLGVMLNALPNARGIHLLRHPCGYIASVLRGERNHKFVSSAPTSEDYGIFKAALGTSLDQKYGLSSINFRALAPHERLAWQWVLLNEKTLTECQPTGRSLCVYYEDVCLDPEEQTSKIFEFSGLDFSPQTREFITRSTTNSKNDYYGIMKNPLHASTQWQRELSSEVIDGIITIARSSPFWTRYRDDRL